MAISKAPSITMARPETVYRGEMGLQDLEPLKGKVVDLTSEFKRLRKDFNIARARLGTKDERVSDREWIAGAENDLLDLQDQIDTLNRQIVVAEKKGIEETELEKQKKEEEYGKSLVDRLLDIEKEISPVSEEQRKTMRGAVESEYGALLPETERAIRSEAAKRGGLYGGGYIGALGESATKLGLAKTQALSNVEKYLEQVQAGKRGEARAGLTTALGTIKTPGVSQTAWQEYLAKTPSYQTGGGMPPKAPEWWEPLVEAGGDIGAYAIGSALTSGSPIGGAVATKGWDWLKNYFKKKPTQPVGYPRAPEYA